MKRVLMIAYHFPPMKGSSGIQRTLRFASYLPAYGWDPVVLTVKPTAYDTASNDHGPSARFETHQILSEANVYGLENVAHLEKLPAKGATLIAAPIKIESGTGGPARLIGILP